MALVEFVKLALEIAGDVRDEKTLAKLRELQRLTADIQVDFATLTEQRLQMMVENTTLKLKVAEFEKQVNFCDSCELKQAGDEHYIEHRGGLFKQKPSGGYHDAVFCIKCRKPMTSFNKLVPFTCNGCHTAVDFTGRELWRVMQELPHTAKA